MIKKIVLFVSLLLLLVCTVQGQSFAGMWYGKANLGMHSLRINFDLALQASTWSGRMQSPDQSEAWIPFTRVHVSGDSVTLEIESIDFMYTGKLSGDSLAGAFTQFGGTYVLNLSREEILRKRLQETTGEVPYMQEKITFHNEKAGINLAGTLTLPSGTGPYPVVLLVSGSGPQDRDEALAGHKPFQVLADYLTRQGIGVLRYDDRGVGASEGDYNTSGLADFTEDALAGIHYLRARPDVAAGKVGLIGHSMGGCVAFMLAAAQEVDYIVTLAGMGISGTEMMPGQRAAILQASGAPEAVITLYNERMGEAERIALKGLTRGELEKELLPVLQKMSIENQMQTMVLQLSSPEYLSLLRFDPVDYYGKISCPVLALNGEKDLQVLSSDHLNGIRTGLAHNPKVTVKSYPELNHLFQTAVTGLPQEYMEIEETFSPEVLNDIAHWILRQTQ